MIRKLNTKTEIYNWLEKMQVKNYHIHEDLSVSGISLLLDNRTLSFIPFDLRAFEKISLNGNFFSEATLPKLPNNLENLSIENNHFKLLPNLPTNLKRLNIKNNPISHINALPKHLIKFNCESTQLTTLPALPKTLKVLNVNNLKLSTLPELPSGLEELTCANNNLITLPILPQSLKELGCSTNNLTSLTLPNKLQKLYCTNNHLTELQLPENLEILYCNKNKLTELSLPESLKILWIESNPLRQFNIPSNLERISIYTSQMDKITHLPKKLRYLSLGVECLHSPTIKDLTQFVSLLSDKEYLEAIAIPNIEKKFKHHIKVNGKKRSVQLFKQFNISLRKNAN